MSNEFYTFSKYMNEKELLSASEEDYVEMIHRLLIKDSNVRINDIVNSLNVKPSSASNMVKKLRKKNLITHQDYGKIELTEKGYKIGKYLYERHNIINEFLKLINVKENLLQEVEKIEHTMSIETVDSIQILVKYFQENQNLLIDFKKHLNKKKAMKND